MPRPGPRAPFATIDVYGFGEFPGVGQYMVMEFLEGAPLSALIAESAPMTPQEVLPILDEVLAALTAAHSEGIIHRDLKPSNIFLADESAGSRCVKLLDFGLSKRSSVEGRAESVNVVVGTPEYMPPEQARAERVGPAADLYSLGMIAYEMLTGWLPFRGPSAMAIVIDQVNKAPPPPSTFCAVPEGLEKLILKLLSKDPAQRPTTPALRAQLRQIGRELASAETFVGTRPGKNTQTQPVSAPAATPAASQTQKLTIPRSAIEATARSVSATAREPVIPPAPRTEREVEARSDAEQVSAAPSRRPWGALVVGAALGAALFGYLLWPRPAAEPPKVAPANSATAEPAREPTAALGAPPAARSTPQVTVAEEIVAPPAADREPAPTTTLAPTRAKAPPPAKAAAPAPKRRPVASAAPAAPAVSAAGTGLLRIFVHGCRLGVFIDGAATPYSASPIKETPLPSGSHHIRLASEHCQTRTRRTWLSTPPHPRQSRSKARSRSQP